MVTRKDIAERVGVSVSVVSRALNSSGYVDREKRERILEAARELGYGQGEGFAPRSLEPSRQILFYSVNVRNPFNIELYNGAADAARDRGYDVILSRFVDFTDPRAAMADGLMFANESIAGGYLRGVGRLDFRPLVCADFGSVWQPPRHIDAVQCDLWRGTQTVVDYLNRLGHERIALTTPFPAVNQDSRIAAWRACLYPVFGDRLDDYYLGVTDDARAPSGDGDLLTADGRHGAITPEDFFENGAIAARQFIEKRCDATAIICFNEEMALGFCKRFRRLGKRIPEDLSVVGFDGTYLRRYFDQPLTVLDMHPYLVGRECTEVLMAQIEGKRARKARRLPVDILEGATVRRLK